MRPTQNNVFISGSSGSGKSYFIIDWICHDLIPWGNATIITNLPIGVVPQSHFEPPNFEGETFVDRIVKHTRQECADRFVVLDDETLEAWENAEGGPWDLELPPGEKYLILDEFANYCSIGLQEKNRDTFERWTKWLAKARHANCHNLMISQNSQKIPRRIFAEFGEKWQMADTGSFVVPRLNCLEGDVNQLVSKALRTEYAVTQCKIRINEGGTWTDADELPIYRVRRSRKIFRLYDSFSAPEIGGESSNRTKEWEVFSWPRMMAWFASRNMGAVLLIASYLAFFLGVLYAGFLCASSFGLLEYRSGSDQSADAGHEFGAEATAQAARLAAIAAGRGSTWPRDTVGLEIRALREATEQSGRLVRGLVGDRIVVSDGGLWWMQHPSEGEDFQPQNSVGTQTIAVSSRGGSAIEGDQRGLDRPDGEPDSGGPVAGVPAADRSNWRRLQSSAGALVGLGGSAQ